MTEPVYAALAWTGKKFERDVVIEVRDGHIEGVRSREPSEQGKNRAILPGFVSAHSHSFQRALRGRGETFPHGEGSFWSWREAMYGLVQSLDRERFYDAAVLAFREMLAAGITTVGEFHYLPEFDEAVLAAAGDAGIRIVLLKSYYRTGGINKPMQGVQLRFKVPNVKEYWRSIDSLAGQLDSATQSLGASAHSIRAATPEEISLLYREATRRGMVFHMHLEEQQREVDESVAAYGTSPSRVLLGTLEIGENFTAVHGTQTARRELKKLMDRGARVCVTPLTEANLGDGVAKGEILRGHPDQICLGTDSNARISMLEEMRWLEYGQRLAGETRGFFHDEWGRVAPLLLRAATAGGARSLGLRTGVIEPGALADFVAIDLEAPQLRGWSEETLLEMIIFGGGESVIAEVWVGGKRLQPSP